MGSVSLSLRISNTRTRADDHLLYVLIHLFIRVHFSFIFAFARIYDVFCISDDFISFTIDVHSTAAAAAHESLKNKTWLSEKKNQNNIAVTRTIRTPATCFACTHHILVAVAGEQFLFHSSRFAPIRFKRKASASPLSLLSIYVKCVRTWCGCRALRRRYGY